MSALLARWNEGEQEICPVHSRSPLDSQLLHQERSTPRAPLREEARRQKKKCKKRHFFGIQDRLIRDEKFHKNMIDIGRNEEVCREMDKLAN